MFSGIKHGQRLHYGAENVTSVALEAFAVHMVGLHMASRILLFFETILLENTYTYISAF